MSKATATLNVVGSHKRTPIELNLDFVTCIVPGVSKGVASEHTVLLNCENVMVFMTGRRTSQRPITTGGLWHACNVGGHSTSSMSVPPNEKSDPRNTSHASGGISTHN